MISSKLCSVEICNPSRVGEILLCGGLRHTWPVRVFLTAWTKG